MVPRLPGRSPETTMLLSVQKMSCGHCIQSVTTAVRALDPNARVEVDIAMGTVRIAGGMDAEIAARSLRDIGYTVHVIES